MLKKLNLDDSELVKMLKKRTLSNKKNNDIPFTLGKQTSIILSNNKKVMQNIFDVNIHKSIMVKTLNKIKYFHE